MLDRNDTINGVACLPSIAIIADVRRGRGGSQLGSFRRQVGVVELLAR